MKLSPEQRRYVLIGQLLVPIAVNFVLNGLIGLAMFGGMKSVPVWGMGPSAGPDTIGTCFFLPAITCLIVTAIVRRHVQRGVVAPATGTPGLPSWLHAFRGPLAKRAATFGLFGLVLAGSLVAVAFLSLGITELGLEPFLWFKAIFSAALGAVVTPLIGLVALAEPSKELPGVVGGGS